MNIENEIGVLEAIATGRAVAFIGSGPSCEMGYPGWGSLAEEVGKRAAKECKKFDEKVYAKALVNKKYPEAFGYVEECLSREFLCKCIAEILIPDATGSDNLYQALAKLPFACYLTTNYDDEVDKHLKKIGKKQFVVRGNERESFYSFRDDMQDFVYKIHGDLSHPSTAVITSADYAKFASSPECEYFRERLRMLFGMKRTITIGYSLEDRDLANILEGLKQTASEIAPAYIFLPNPNPLDIKEFRERFGIKVISYKVDRGNHSALIKKLNTYQMFLSKCTPTSKRVSEDSKRAASLYMFRTLNAKSRNLDLENYVLMLVPGADEKGKIEDVIRRKSSISSSDSLHQTLVSLIEKGLVVKVGASYSRTHEGDEVVLSAQAAFQAEKDAATEQFLSALSVPKEEGSTFSTLLQDCLAVIFEKRGDALAKSIFERSNYSAGAMVDIYQSIMSFAQCIPSVEVRGSFVRAVYDFIVMPTSHQKAYLVALAQGYFLYHMMGRSSHYADLVRDSVQSMVWYVDSNLLIPLVATGCANYKFARDMFLQLKKLNVRVVVVPSVLEEVSRHLKWACEHDPDDKNNYSYATSFSCDRQNLFVDGYIRTKASGRVKSFRQYLSSVNVLLYGDAKTLISSYGMKFENPRTRDRWEDSEFEEIMSSLESRRRETGSYRRHFQVKTDAELLYAMRLRIEKNRMDGTSDKVCFLSQSTLFEEEETEIKTWSGEAMYRVLQMANPAMSSDETLQECLQNELYNVGMHFIDVRKYSEFFRDEIDFADLKFKEQEEEFRKCLQEPDAEEFRRKYAELPELQRPIFIRQMQTKLERANKEIVTELSYKLLMAEAENAARRKIEEGEKEEVVLLKEELRKKKATLQTVTGELRNLKNGSAYKRRKRRKRK